MLSSDASGTPPTKSAGRNPGLDALRAIAILVVVAAHVFPASFVALNPQAHGILGLGVRGVDLFFVLSGYLVGGIAIKEMARQGGLNVRRFWARRWFRTLPAYYAVLGLYALKQLLPHRSAGLGNPVDYVFFLQGYVHHGVPDFTHSWSLCVEEHFYLLLPIALVGLGILVRARPKHILLFIACFGIVMMAVRTALIITGGEPNVQLSVWRTDGLCVGVALAAWEQMNPEAAHAKLSRNVGLLLAVASTLTVGGLAIQWYGSPHWQPVIALACGAWVALAVGQMHALAALGRLRAVAFTSAISYSLYLLHPLVLSTLQTLTWFRRSPVYLIGYGVLGIGLSLVVAWGSYELVELRFLTLRERRFPEGPRVASPATTAP